jgi:hypothetical protein
MKATKKNKEEPATQVAVLLTAMGKEAISVYKTFCWAEDDDKDKLDTVLKAFDNYFKPKRNVIYERFIFLQRKQKPGETFESFYTDLLRLVETCDYHAEEKGNIIRDQVVMNISSDTIREKLLHESGLTLERAVDMCRSMEATSSYLKSMSAMAIPTKECETVAAETEKVFAIPTMECDTITAHTMKATAKPRKQCQYCGQVHKPRSCPAWGRQCGYCGKMNRSRDVCRKAVKDRQAGIRTTDAERKREAENAISRGQGDDAAEAKCDYFAYALHGDNADSREWNIFLEMRGRGLKAKVDTGATCNVIPLAAYQVLCRHPPHPTSTHLTAYGGGKLDVCGQTTQEVLYNGIRRPLDFVVVRVTFSR